MPVRRERHYVSAGDGGEAMVHCRMSPGAGLQNNDSGRGGGYGGAAKGDGVHCYGRLQCGIQEDGWPGTGRGYCGGSGNGRPRRS